VAARLGPLKDYSEEIVMDDAQVAEKVKMLAFRKEYLKGIVMVNLLDDVMVTQSVYM
jgi:hypothetical protein